MADFDDLSFDSGPATPPPAPAPPSSPPLLPAAIVIVVFFGGVGALWYFSNRNPAPEPAATPAVVAHTDVDLPHAPARGTAEPGEAIDLPPLDQTDAIVRTLVGKLSSHPVVAAWLTTDGLIRNIVVVVNRIAEGESPAKQLKPLRPVAAFSTNTRDGVTWIDAASYRRYDAIADAVDGLDARGVARFYATIKPRINDAYHEMIGPNADFDRTLERAIVMLLRTPNVSEDVQVRSGAMTYAFANPELEALPKVQRQFLRMGPRNVRLVKAKLREVAGHLGIPDSALPPA